jgi:hypothetical protein
MKRPPSISRQAGQTPQGPVTRPSDPTRAVEAFGQDAGQGGLADAARAGEQVGVVQAALGQGVGQCADHMFLAHQLRETARAPFAGEDLVAHGGRCPAGNRSVVVAETDLMEVDAVVGFGHIGVGDVLETVAEFVAVLSPKHPAETEVIAEIEAAAEAAPVA